MGVKGRCNLANLRPKQVGEGKHPQKRTLMREALLDRVVAQWDHRDALTKIRSKGKFDCWLDTLSDSDFLTIILKILPRQTDVNITDDGETLRKLIRTAKGVQSGD